MRILSAGCSKIILGYSGFKQYNVSFLLLKSAYYILKQSCAKDDIKQAAIIQVEKVERENLWKYATCQMVVILIYNMRFDGSGLLIITKEHN